MIGRYQILRELGRGAGGVVYLAEDPKIGRKVAIKTIAAGAAGGDTLRKRLQREARSGGSLAHQNIVTVFEMDDTGATIYIVMEFVEGTTLREMMESGGRMRSAEIIALLRQVASGLDYAHARAVVHRDIKPANIMVTSDSGVKIADFGVAKMLDDATMGLTQAGMAVGTPHYMSPEQVLGKPVEGRSDQFSLAVIAYELLAGKRPFEGDSITSIMYQIVNEDPVREDTTGSIVGLPALPALLRALAKDPEQRYPTCQQFIDELEAGLRLPRLATAPPPVAAAAPPPPPAEPARPVSPPVVSQPAPASDATAAEAAAPAAARRSRAGLIGGIAAAAVLIAGGLFFLRGGKENASPAPAEPSAAGSAEPAASVSAPAPAPANTTAPASGSAPAPASGKTGGPASTGAPVSRHGPVPAQDDSPAAAPAIKPAATAPSPKTPQTAAAEAPAAETAAVRGPHGTFTWTGTLASGDSLEISAGEPSFGALSGKAIPRHTPVAVQIDPPDVHVSEGPSADNGYKLVLVNDGRDVSSITVSWRLARKGEATE